ncbi:hypothetical protein SprV_0501912600 [Sparganum proliferum]
MVVVVAHLLAGETTPSVHLLAPNSHLWLHVAGLCSAAASRATASTGGLNQVRASETAAYGKFESSSTTTKNRGPILAYGRAIKAHMGSPIQGWHCLPSQGEGSRKAGLNIAGHHAVCRLARVADVINMVETIKIETTILALLLLLLLLLILPLLPLPLSILLPILLLRHLLLHLIPAAASLAAAPDW